LKILNTKEGWWRGSSNKSACLARVRRSIQTPVSPKKKREREKERVVGSGQVAQKYQYLFKGQFIGCKGKGQEKSWWSFQERLG
jgi:hypothetical protein